MNVSRSKITLKFTGIAGIKKFKSDTFCIIDHEVFYKMVALCITGKVLNLAHFLLQLKQIQNYFKGINLFLSS